MIELRNRFTRRSKQGAAGATLAVLIASGGTPRLAAQNEYPANSQQDSSQSKFFCNRKALSATERAHHTQLTDKLVAARKQIVESPNGYEFQFSPSSISIAELADWVAAEGKCCPFFDFHIDLEREGSLLCLRLNGADGVKPFMRAEFQIPTM
jgi:hypothetical protein